jgi:ubiquinol-cytochrome c reductase iron-sulfur subunit
VDNEQNSVIDARRRRWLIATSVTGGIGCAATLVPFAAYLGPSTRARAEAAPITVDIAGLHPGEIMTVAWRGMPVFIVNRTAAMMSEVIKATPQVADPASDHTFSMPLPAYCHNAYRSRKDHSALLVVIGICTHLGCTPIARFAPGAQPSLPADWPGGFLCPCHGSTYDLAGRVFKDKPAPQNLDVPRYMYGASTNLVIGRDEHGEA